MRRPDPQEWLTVADAARELGLCRETVAKAIQVGTMPGYKFGSQYRIPVELWRAFKRGQWRPQTVSTTAQVQFLHRKAS